MPHVFDDSALEDAPARGGAAAPQFGFSLIDDCGGRFVIDPVTGFISVTDEDIVVRDHGRTFEARMRVIEKSGGTYDMPVRLVITGIVPRMAGGESFGAFSLEDTPTPPSSEPLPFSEARWNTFAAFAARAPQHRQDGGLTHAAFGALHAQTPANLTCPRAVLSVPAPAFDYSD